MQVATIHKRTVAARTGELKLFAERKGVLTATTPGADGQTYSLAQFSSRSKLHDCAELANAEVATMVKHRAQNATQPYGHRWHHVSLRSNVGSFKTVTILSQKSKH